MADRPHAIDRFITHYSDVMLCDATVHSTVVNGFCWLQSTCQKRGANWGWMPAFWAKDSKGAETTGCPRFPNEKNPQMCCFPKPPPNPNPCNTAANHGLCQSCLN